jgi:hypothetical protein
MSPEWIPLLFVSAMMFLLLVTLRPRKQSARYAIWRAAFLEAAYLGVAYLLLHVLQHPPAEALFGALASALLAGLILPKRVYRVLSGEK